MNIRNLLSVALFIGLTASLSAQTEDEPQTEIGRQINDTLSTISEVDAQFQARQRELLAEDEDPLWPDEDAPEASLDTTDIGLDLPETVPMADPEIGDVEMDFGESQRQSIISRDADTISVDFPDEDVRTIIRNVADLYELNVVIPDTLVGRVSLKLRDVTWRQVFDVVLEPLNFTWIEDRNIIRIRSQNDLLAEPVVTRVFVINFARAGELQSSVAPLVDGGAGGRIQVDNRSNSLVITERPSRMNDIQAIIDRLDRPTEQVMIESKFIEINRTDERHLGIDWSALEGFGVSAGPFEREYTSESGRIATRENTSGEGTSFDPATGEFGMSFDEGSGSSRSYLDDVSRLDTAVFSADQFGVILRALRRDNKVELVSNPTVVTINNTPAQINISEEFPIPSYRYNPEQGVFEVNGFEYKPIGILLNVTPQVNQAGFINLNIAPEISSRTGEVSFGGASGATIPIVSTRRTESTVTIKSGFTLAIGGLMETNTGNLENKVPFLGDVPLLGRLFRSNSDAVDSRNLIVFITAKVLNPDGSTYRDVFSEETLLRMGVSDRSVPGYQPSPEEQALYDRVREERNELESLKARAELQRELQLLQELEPVEEPKAPEVEPHSRRTRR